MCFVRILRMLQHCGIQQNAAEIYFAKIVKGFVETDIIGQYSFTRKELICVLTYQDQIHAAVKWSPCSGLSFHIEGV